MPIGITQTNFPEQLRKVQRFELQHFELYDEKKKIMMECVVSALKHKINISNSHLMRNADGLLSGMDKDPEVNWVGKNKTRVQQFETTY